MPDEQLQFDLGDQTPPSRLPRFRKKPVEVEAVQLSWRTWGEVCEFLGDALGLENPEGAGYTEQPTDSCGEVAAPYIQLYVRTAQNQQILVRHGEWLLRDQGEHRFYPVHPKVFAETYDPI